ncbi:hypothetical protein [Glaesserella parasuis]|uniref:hypothetical protein n=1 Tax=Glaesserella parasuis TaxID=738 RepID=UPI00132725B9|nr:hypothetical protein [Glaesserella parasuis]MDG6259119.1 hypothetical protein [Glaesserella parasuis]MDG6269719.1 hypothetical protein [Glaesserella parasuis]MDG6297673.1 hypothetical protein [Glaesserella parasuis]MDG6333153.1 hypothetical protein [Glaesserella parasuis]MDG6341695.1 hypothetical protein [Glaesserella parasuis]
MKNITEQILLISIGIIIGILFGLGFSDWSRIDSGSVTNWIIAFGTVLLFIVALYTALSWRAQRIPEARKDFINAIVDFDNYIYQFSSEDFTSTPESFLNYHNQLLNKFWNVEKSIMYFYQFDKKDKANIDAQYCKIIELINKFGCNLKSNRHGNLIVANEASKLNTEVNAILPESYTLLKLVAGENLTIKYQEKQHDKHPQP